MASFGSPNRTGVMNSLPPEHRGAGSGMNTTFQNSAQVLSIGIFFTLMIVGLVRDPAAQRLGTGSLRHGVPAATAERAAHLPPVSTLFAAFLGYNPVAHLVGRRDAGAPAPRRNGLRSPGTASSPASSRRRSRPACTPPSTSPS